MRMLKWLLAFGPIALVLDQIGANPILVFLASAIAIVPLAGLMGDATEALAGPRADPGGAAERDPGECTRNHHRSVRTSEGPIGVVKSSLTGSIVGNLLFGLGNLDVRGGGEVPDPEV